MNRRGSHGETDPWDDELVEHAAQWSDALRAVAQRWRFRVEAGRIGRHSLVQVIHLAESLEAAAHTLEGSSPEGGAVTPREGVEVGRVLKESEERFRLLVDSVRDYAIFMLDPEGRVSSWNSGAERIKGWRAEEILGKSFELFYPEEAVKAGHPKNELAIAIREGSYHEEGWRVRKDGSQIWADVTITALHSEQGRLRGFAKVTRDMTERRVAEEAVRKLNVELEQRVVARTAALQAANKELEAFSYSVSHDLRTPLRAVDGFSKLLLDKYEAALDTQGRHYLARIRSGAQRMSQLIDDLLRLSRFSRSELRARPVDLAAIARGVAEDLRRSDPGRQVEFVIPEHLPARGDAQLLRVVLENLLGNAWKFTRKKPRARVEVGVVPAAFVEAADGEAVYFVRDDGAGFEMEYADKLFAPFQRLHDASEFEGTGIGLATVQRVVARHGGRVWAEGAPDRGATIHFTLGEGGEG